MSEFKFIDHSKKQNSDAVFIEIAYQLKRLADFVEDVESD